MDKSKNNYVSLNLKFEIEKLEKQIDFIKRYLLNNPYRNIEIFKKGQRHYVYLRNQENLSYQDSVLQHDSISILNNVSEHDSIAGLDNAPEHDNITGHNEMQKHDSITGQNNSSGKMKYISVNSPLLKPLINVKYYRKLLPTLESELKALKHFDSHYNPDLKYNIINCIPDVYKKAIDLAIKPPEVLYKEWESASFISNPYPFTDGTSIITRKGERVRSKAEYIIANILNDLGLSYRYESQLKIGNKVFYPDFTIIHPRTGELYYLEYFGMMDNEEYMSAALKKISFYQQSELSSKFLYVFESALAPMNIKSIQSLLQHTFF